MWIFLHCKQVSRHSLPGFSAACWYFGEELDKGINAQLEDEEKIPIGLVASFVGGKTVAKQSTLYRYKMLDEIPCHGTGTFIEQWIPERNISDCQQQMCGNAKGGGLDGRQTINPQVCGSLYNGHIAPFVNQTITGVVWYVLATMHESMSFDCC